MIVSFLTILAVVKHELLKLTPLQGHFHFIHAEHLEPYYPLRKVWTLGDKKMQPANQTEAAARLTKAEISVSDSRTLITHASN